MTPYWLMFVFWSLGAVQSERRRVDDPRKLMFISAAIAMTVIIGLRFEVGTDWANYVDIYKTLSLMTLPDALRVTDPAYGFLNWLGSALGLGIVFVNAICAILFFYGFAVLAWKQPNPALAVLVAVPYFIIVVAMGYTRQAAAIGFLCLAISDTSEQRIIRVFLLIGLASLFHKSAVLMLPLLLSPVFIRNYALGALGIIVFAILFIFVLRGSGEGLISQYVTSTYDSQGAAVRIAMNVVASLVFLIFRKGMSLSYFEKVYWTANAGLALISIIGLASFSASSGVDRFSLYLIPLQVVTYSRLPYAVRSDGRAILSILFGVIFYSFCVQFVWLNFADNAYAWLPYRNIIWSDD